MNVDSRRTLIPTSSVAVGSWLAPMIASPRLVLVKNSPSTTASTARVPISHNRWSEICTSRIVTRSSVGNARAIGRPWLSNSHC